MALGSARTWGGVIGIDGLPGLELVDGTHITVPRYAFAFNASKPWRSTRRPRRHRSPNP
jgi:hypothetical protein